MVVIIIFAKEYIIAKWSKLAQMRARIILKVAIDKAITQEKHAQTRTRTGDIQIFSLTLSQLSYLGESGPDAIRTHDLRHVKATS